MKKLLLLAAAAMLVGCITDPNVIPPEDQQDVNIFLAPSRAPAQTETTYTLSDFCTHLDVWFYEGETLAAEVHQSSTDEGFGEISLTMNRSKTYQMIAVSHKCTGNATLTNNVIAFPDEKVTHAFVGKTTFSPQTISSIDLDMNRIVGQFRMTITDVVPDEVAKFVFTVAQTGTRWNVSTDAAANIIDRTSTINLTQRDQGGGATLVLYIIPDDLTQAYEYDIHVEAQTSAGVLVESHDFEDVQIQAGYKSLYQGQFFVATPMSFSFLVTDWNEFDVVEF